MSHMVTVIGFGYIGSVIGAVLASSGIKVLGIDKDKRIIDAVKKGMSPFNEPGLQELISSGVASGNLSVSEDISSCRGSEVFVVTVGTPLSDSYNPDLSQIVAAIKMIQPFVQDGTLVILKSTVPPFTTEAVVAPILLEKAKVHLAFCPERLAEGSAIRELTSIPVVVGGIDEESIEKAAAFWESALGVEIIKVGNARTAEMVKLADNLWIDLNIALAGELAQLSDKMDIDVLEVIRAANSLPKGNHHVNILTPSVGVGGYCLTKDPWFVYSLGKRYGLDLSIPRVSRTVNDGMPLYSVSLIDALLKETGKDSGAMKVGILGIAFKNNTGDCRYTPTKPVISELINLGYRVQLCDPWVSEEDASRVTALPVIKDAEPVIKDSDCVAFLAGHREFHQIPIERIAELAKPNALIFDGRMFFDKQKIRRMRELGLRYKGVGR